MDTLKIHNSLSGRKETFVPLEPGKVRMYVCGMTIYDYCHLGHARVMVVFDVVARYLRSCGYDVTYVRNITDIDDHKFCAIVLANDRVLLCSDTSVAREVNNQTIRESEHITRWRPSISGEPRRVEHVAQLAAYHRSRNAIRVYRWHRGNSYTANLARAAKTYQLSSTRVTA